jgi:hypothetical protein
MVKKAEVVRKRSPLLPVFGLITAVALFAIAYVLSSEVVVKIRQVRDTIPLQNMPLARWAFAFVIWLVLLGVAYFLVSLLVGKDPETATNVVLPTKQKDLPKEQRRGYRKR